MLSVALALVLCSSWTLFTHVLVVKASPGWLSGWDKRVELTIDSTKVDSGLSDFPVLIYLSTSSGRNNEDVSFVFDELQSDDNRKKIAVTTSDGTTECYVEIERWNDTAEEAWLWVKVPTVSSSTDTLLYLYYDSGQPDNTAYVGDTDSAPAENVWDTGFRGVWHLPEDPSDTPPQAKDSTSNNNDGTSNGSMTSGDQVRGSIDGSLQFDGDDDYVNMEDPASLDMGTSDLTIEAWVRLNSSSTNSWNSIVWRGAGGYDPGYWFHWRADISRLRFCIGNQTNDRVWVNSVTNIKNDNLYYAVAVADRDGLGTIYLNGTLDNSADFSSFDGQSIDTTRNFCISDEDDGFRWMGVIDEVRVSNTTRSLAWIKASYESGRDDLLDFGSEENPEVDTYDSGYINPKDIYTIGETVYAKAANLAEQGGWLSGWAKRVKLTIDKNDVDSALSDFPVLINLSTSSGRGPDDVSFVFDELQSDENRKKIAVTRSDGTTECYVEIERWVQATEKAWLWVKAPSVSGTVDTDLYLYYDKDHADNTAQVGDVDSAVAQNVWDGNFKGVWHLSETSGGSGAIKDSTSNNNDGTDNGPTLGATGKIDSAIEFDGIDDYIKVGDSAGLRGMAQLTLECWVNLQTKEAWNRLLEKANDTASNLNQEYLFILDDSADQKMSVDIWTTSGGNWVLSDAAFPTNQWVYVVGRYNGTTVNLYINGVAQTQSSSTSGNIRNFANPLAIGAGAYHILDSIDGIMDEVRISDTGRSTAWIKANYESERDHLIDFEAEESRLYDFRYYSDWLGTPAEEGSQLNVPQDPSGEWQSSYSLEGDDPTGTWGVRVFDAGTSTEMASCSFTVQAVPEFPHGAKAVLIAGFAIFLAKRKTLRRRGKEP